jgi:hypothetical protein
MAKGILEFDLFEEREEFNIAQKGAHLAYVIDQLDQYLRRKLKYEEITEEQHKVYEEIRSKLWEIKGE